jgi:type II secretory pathway pseudopilin PulG
MELRGQHGERGYAMAALLVALAVMAVLMSAALPVWRHQAKREKEAELIFRGEQYARAISLWEKKMGPGSRPPNLDILVEQKFLRKKYKDPMTEDGEFLPLMAGANLQPGGPGQRGRGGRAMQPPTPTPFGRGGPVAGGIFGVVSKSTEASIRLYKGRGRYNEWQFVHAGSASAPGAPEGSPTPGLGRGRGQRNPGAPPGSRGRSTPGPMPGTGRGRGQF